MNKRKPWNFLAIVAALALLLPALVWAAYPGEIPRTGQTTCYDDNGTIIDCDGTGQDGAIQAGAVWPDPRFIDHGDNTTTDNLTGLMWANNANLLGTDDADNDTDGTAGDGAVTWQHALDYIKKLNSEHYLNYTDWRLPNTRELRSLADYELYGPALPLNYPFTNVQSDYYWSSTSGADDTVGAWIVGMYGGHVSYGYKTSSNFVWPVRAGQCGSFDNSTTTTTVGSTTTVPTTTSVVITTTSIISSTTTTAGGESTTTTTVSSGGTTTTSIAAATTTTTTTGICPAKKALGENNPNLENLRDFRDSKLAQSAVGRRIIGIYYNNAGSINAALERSPALRAVTRRVLEVIAPMIGKKE
jgi:hypothetical protein